GTMSSIVAYVIPSHLASRRRNSGCENPVAGTAASKVRTIAKRYARMVRPSVSIIAQHRIAGGRGVGVQMIALDQAQATVPAQYGIAVAVWAHGLGLFEEVHRFAQPFVCGGGAAGVILKRCGVAAALVD